MYLIYLSCCHVDISFSLQQLSICMHPEYLLSKHLMFKNRHLFRLREEEPKRTKGEKSIYQDHCSQKSIATHIKLLISFKPHYIYYKSIFHYHINTFSSNSAAKYFKQSTASIDIQPTELQPPFYKPVIQQQ